MHAAEYICNKLKSLLYVHTKTQTCQEIFSVCLAGIREALVFSWLFRAKIYDNSSFSRQTVRRLFGLKCIQSSLESYIWESDCVRERTGEEGGGLYYSRRFQPPMS